MITAPPESSKRRVTRLQEKCPECGKVAKERFTLETKNDKGETVKLITLDCFHIITVVIPKDTPFHLFTTYDHQDSGCDHEWDRNHCVLCNAYKLFDFQIEGARFIEMALATHKGAGVFDEMGLGKTIQVLAYLAYHPEAFPVLTIVKSGIKFQWFKEFIRWLGPMYIAQAIKTSKDPLLPGLNVYIVSYDLLRRFDREKIIAAGIKTIILDECQQIKNPDSARTQEVRQLVEVTENVIPLSGTPWKNRGSEFYPVLNMIDPKRFYSYQGFFDEWVDTYNYGARTKVGGIRKPEKFKEYVSDIVIRRERTEVMAELPLINRVIHYTELDKVEQAAYNEEVSEFVKWYNEKVIGGEEESFETQSSMLARLARMRHITGLAKIPATVEFVTDHINETGRKIVVFVHHKDVGVLLASEFEKQGMEVMKLTASLSSEDRFVVQEQFNARETCVLIASTQASGEGLNLQTCADCVMHERQWNPANEEQAEGRFIRIGQTASQVNGTYITAAGTVDEFLASIVEEKRANFHAAMNQGEAPVWKQGDIIAELADNIARQASKLQRMASI
jgi:SNF2 family DNA or RNA helicase